MGCKVVRFEADGEERWGVVDGGTVYPLEGRYGSLREFLEQGRPEARRTAAEPGDPATDLEDVSLSSPVTAPCTIVCQGRNYAGHRDETGAGGETPDYNLLFSKADSSLTGARGDVVRPEEVRLLDYEIELGLVIGRAIDGPRSVTQSDLDELVAGWVVANDISAREIQIEEGQWFKGKSYRTFCPVGPFLYLPDPPEFDRFDELELTLTVNGELRQRAVCGDMIHGPAETLRELSSIMDLEPGDLLLTGTPGGVALEVPGPIVQKLGEVFLSEETRLDFFVRGQLDNPAYLDGGDRIEASIESRDGSIDLGTQKLRVVDESGPRERSSD